MEKFAGAYKRLSPRDLSEGDLIKISLDDCCIYRAPLEQRLINPQAYTPRAVLIGPLTHAKKQEALEIEQKKCTSFETETIKYRYKQYMSMERQKLIYYESVCDRLGVDAVTRFRSYIDQNIIKIRQCYAESTSWINDCDFVNIVLLDAIFIVEFFQRLVNEKEHPHDLVVTTSLRDTVLIDLCLLENQLPLFVVKEISDPIFPDDLLENIIISYYPRITIQQKVSERVKFNHIIDLLRCVRVRSFKTDNDTHKELISSLYNVERLLKSGIEFEVMTEESMNSINIRLENKKLKMGCFFVDEDTEMVLRNIIALEQCHYMDEMYMCWYVSLLDFMIETGKDVDILVRRGIIKNDLDNGSLVANMLKKLCYGVTVYPSCYYDIADQLNKHHDSPWNRSMATLRRNYFDDIWTSTATIAGAVLLLLTFVQAATSIIQIMQS